MQSMFRRGVTVLWFLGFSLSVALGQVAFAIDDLGGLKAPPKTPPSVEASGKNPRSHADEVAQLVVDAWKHKIWSLYPVEKLKADEGLSNTAKAEAVTLCAAKGETEPFMLVLRSEVPLRQVNVVAADLLEENGVKLEASNFKIQRAAYIHVDEPSGTRMKVRMPYETGTGEFPDPLLREGSDARPNRNLQFLVTLTVPREAKAGTYRGKLRLEYLREGWMPADSATVDNIPVTVVVRSFALPEVSPLLNTCVASPHALTPWLRKPEIMEELRQEFVSHKQAPDPLTSPKIHISKDGALTVDSTEWEKEAAALLDGNKTNHLFLPTWSMGKHGEMQGLYFLWHYPAVTKQRWFGTVICTESGELTAEFEERFGAYLKHMFYVMERHGWLGRIFISTMDEPYTYHTNDRAQDIPANNYRVIGNFVRFVRKIAPGLRTFATADPTEELNGLIDHWCLRNLDHAAVARERAEKFGEVVTFCDNYRTFIDYPAVGSRSLGWLAWKFGAKGWLTYETLGSFANAWEGPAFVYPQFGGATVWGMGQLFYPSTSGQGYVASSLRWELMHKGCEDYEYLWLLNERLKALSAEQQKGAVAKEARELLAGAANQIVGGTGDAEIATKDRQPNAQSNLIPHTLHQRVGDLIEQLSSK